MKVYDKRNSNKSSNFILSVYLLIMIEVITLYHRQKCISLCFCSNVGAWYFS